MKPLPVWFERTETLAVATAVAVAFVSLHFSWWWLPALFLAFDASMVGYLAGNRAGAVCYNLAPAYVVPALLLLSYVASGTRWCAFLGLLWAFHIAGDRVLGYGLKFTSSFQDTHLGKIGKQRLSSAPSRRHPGGTLTAARVAPQAAPRPVPPPSSRQRRKARGTPRTGSSRTPAGHRCRPSRGRPRRTGGGSDAPRSASRSPLPNPACTCRSAFAQARRPARSRASSAS